MKPVLTNAGTLCDEGKRDDKCSVSLVVSFYIFRYNGVSSALRPSGILHL